MDDLALKTIDEHMEVMEQLRALSAPIMQVSTTAANYGLFINCGCSTSMG